ncbi:MAG: GNAT family N-acetyltransferase [Alphaproteobacteria bacterium]
MTATPPEASFEAPLADGYHVFPRGKVLNVVTWLEMRAPPAAPVAPPLPVVHHRTPDPRWYRPLFLAIGAPWLWTMHMELDDDGLAAALADPALTVLAGRDGGRDVALAVLERHRGGDVEILSFGLVPEATGRGLGPRLMASALAHAFASDPPRVWLHTCTDDHPAALGFYRRCGFVPYRTGIEVLDDPRLTGLLPRDAAPRVPLLEP